MSYDFEHIYVRNKMRDKFIFVWKRFQIENDCKIGKNDYFNHLLDLVEGEVEKMEEGKKEDVI